MTYYTLLPLLSLTLLFLSQLVEARPAHYATRYPQLSPDELHRLFMMHVINQQFESVVEESGIVGHSGGEMATTTTLLDNVHTQHLIDMAFHLAQWYMTPECINQETGELHTDDDIDENRNRMFIAYYNATASPKLKASAIRGLCGMLRVGKLL